MPEFVSGITGQRSLALMTGPLYSLKLFSSPQNLSLYRFEQVYKEIWLRTYIKLEKQEILINSSDNYGYSLLLH